MKDIIIIGAGPVGLYAAFYAGLRGLSGVLLEAEDKVGGQAVTLYGQKPVYDFPGVIEATGQTLIDSLYNQYKKFEDTIKLQLNSPVQKMTKIPGGFEVETPNGIIKTKTICLAIGPGSLNHRKLSIEDEDKYDVSYSVTNIEDFYNKKVVILGGGDSAIDWANMLANKADVTVIHRRDSFRAKEQAVKEMLETSKVILNAKVLNIKSKNITVIKDDKEIVLSFDKILVQYGLITSFGNISNWGMEFKKGKIKVDGTMSSTMEGIWSVGNSSSYDGKNYIITSGLGDVTSAMSSIVTYINPKASPIFFSTDKK